MRRVDEDPYMSVVFTQRSIVCEWLPVNSRDGTRPGRKLNLGELIVLASEPRWRGKA